MQKKYGYDAYITFAILAIGDPQKSPPLVRASLTLFFALLDAFDIPSLMTHDKTKSFRKPLLTSVLAIIMGIFDIIRTYVSLIP